tara:strand:- start:4215 stop:5150 length:936 start_codon:yes stop_codon:yes gene_type:complete
MKKILVTGGTGLIGTAIKRISENYSYNFVFSSSRDCDLRNYVNTCRYINELRPDYVIHLAANVGGLYKNMKYKVEMLEINNMINRNVIRACHESNISNLLCCLSTCIFPDKTSYPISEDMLHNGPPHDSNYPYAYSKRMMEVMCRTYNEQHHRNYICVIPTNIYGPNDNYHLGDSHVIPGLIHKCFLAKKKNDPFMVMGSGNPRRQFIYSDDLARLMLWTIEEYRDTSPIILSVPPEKEVSIETVARLIADNFDYQDNLKFDTSFEDGQFRKTADNSKLMTLYPDVKFTSLEDGIKNSVTWFIDNYDSARK